VLTSRPKGGVLKSDDRDRVDEGARRATLPGRRGLSSRMDSTTAPASSGQAPPVPIGVFAVRGPWGHNVGSTVGTDGEDEWGTSL
jgi:hypothetical protein